MKKNYLLVCLLLIASVSFSQQSDKLKFENHNSTPTMYDYTVPGNEYIKGAFTEGKPTKVKNNNDKVYLDTLWYTSLDSVSASEWTITDPNNNGNIWEWNTTLRPGNFSQGIGAIQSTTGSDGFLSMPADFYNSPPPNPLVEMSSAVISPKITIDKSIESVYLHVQQYFAMCCFFADMHFLEVSTDSTEWTLVPGITTNTPIGFTNRAANNIQPDAFNISAVLIDRDTSKNTEFWVRFRVDRNVRWFWMLDDVTILEGPKNDIELRDPRILFNANSFGVVPSYGQIPYDLFPESVFRATIFNNGSDTAFNTTLHTDVTRTNDIFGTFVDEHIYSQTEELDLAPFNDSLNALIVSELDVTFSPLTTGAFRVNYEVTTDSADQIIGDETDSLFFITSDTVFARDDGGFLASNSIGPVTVAQGTSQGGFDGDACGTVYNIESRTSTRVFPTSISFYVSDDIANDGISISPSVWTFYEDTPNVVDAWYPEDIDNSTGLGLRLFGDIYQVQLSDTNSFITLALDSTDSDDALIGGYTGLENGQYVVGWEVISGSTTARDKWFAVSTDQTTAARQPFASSLLYHANTVPKNIIPSSATTQFQPVIRLNIADLPRQVTSVNDPNNSKSDIFDVVPNPTTGQVKINIAVESAAIYNLNVRNMLGQSVYSDILPVNGATTERIDLSSFEKGVYFLTLENATERLQKKIILK